MIHQEGLIQAFIRRQGWGAISYEEVLNVDWIELRRALRGYYLLRRVTRKAPAQLPGPFWFS